MFTDKDGNTINYDNNNEDNIPNNIEITGVDEQKRKHTRTGHPRSTN